MESKEEKYLRARERVAALKKFYGSVASFVVFNAMLIAINYFTSWHTKWFLWVTFFWGIGLAFEAAKVFGASLFFGKNWESKKIKELMDEDEKDDVRFNRWE